jgi:hypothetical protein
MTKERIAEVASFLEEMKMQLHERAFAMFNGDITDPVFCKASIEANTIAKIRCRVLANEIEV